MAKTEGKKQTGGEEKLSNAGLSEVGQIAVTVEDVKRAPAPQPRSARSDVVPPLWVVHPCAGVHSLRAPRRCASRWRFSPRASPPSPP